jgi:hypothetical protein
MTNHSSHDPDPLWSGKQLTRFEHAQAVYEWHLTAPGNLQPPPDVKWARNWLKRIAKKGFITESDRKTILSGEYQV